MRIAFLGPEGTFSEQALCDDSGPSVDHLPMASIYECVLAAQNEEVDRAFVPIENSLEGPVNATLDALTFDAPALRIVREVVQPISHTLIAAEELGLKDIEQVVSLPYASAQCRNFIAENLAQVRVEPAASTAEAVRIVSKSNQRWAAIGNEMAAEIYGCKVIARNIEDNATNVTRFVYLAKGSATETGDSWKTSIVCAIGSDHPGALLEILQVFAERQINLAKIESRPAKTGLGAYLFFIDLEGSEMDHAVDEALAELRPQLDQLRILGSYPVVRNV